MSRPKHQQRTTNESFVCAHCGRTVVPQTSGGANRIAADDDETALLAIAARPIARLPFPIEALLEGRS